MKRTIKSDICLLGAAIIWGFAFVAQRDSMDTIGPFLYSAIRMLLGSLALVPIFLITDSIKNKNRENTETAEEKNNSRRTLIKGGIVAGIVVFLQLICSRWDLFQLMQAKQLLLRRCIYCLCRL